MRRHFLPITILIISITFSPEVQAQKLRDRMKKAMGVKKKDEKKVVKYNYENDLAAIGGPFEDEGMTSDIHTKYVGKIMFSKNKIPKEGALESDFTNEFGYNDYIYGRLYMPRSPKNYPRYVISKLEAGDTIKPDNNNYGNFYYKLYVDGVLDRWPVEFVQLKNDKATTYQVWIHAKPSDHKLDNEWKRIIDDLSPGKHTIKVEMYTGSTLYSSGVEAVVSGEFNITKKSDETFDYGLTFNDIEAKMSNPKLESDMLAAARDYAKVNNYKENFQEVKIANRDWTIIRHELTGVVLRRIIDVHCLALWPDGHCSSQKFVFGQEHDGRNFSNTVRFHGVTYGSYPKKLNCK